MKQKIYKLYGLLHSLKYPKELLSAVQSIFDQRVYDNAKHIAMAADWLLFMQNEDGGYARKFSFIDGRDKSYIETTGYIIQTLLKLQKQKYKNSALKAGEWLLSVQNDDGSFSEIDNDQPFVFDTGQVLLGLNALYMFTNDQRYKQALIKAATWLIQVQEEDGSWERYAYNQEKHTYYSRVAYALYEAGEICEDELLKQKALKNIDWVLSQQLKNGFFNYASFSHKHPPFLHTMVYILEGLLDIYEKTEIKAVLDAVLKNATKLKDIGLEKDFLLCSQYDSDFNCVNKERCMTGLAQYAGVALRLYKLTGDESFLQSASSTLFYLKAKQIKFSPMQGGFSASMPFWGRYGAFDFVNWTNKFFIDAMMEYEKLGIAKTKEQEYYVSNAFAVTSSVVTDNISSMDRKYIEAFEQHFDKSESLRVLDIGCGKGVIIKELEKRYPNYEFVGVDPVFEGENIHQGSIYKIPFEKGSFDVVMSFEVLQHTFLQDALDEIYRVLKPKGKVVIGERNPLSLLGFVKPFYELLGRWMYPFDSAFREKWYSVKEWRYRMKMSGFEMEDMEYIDNENDKIAKTNRYFFIVGDRV